MSNYRSPTYISWEGMHYRCRVKSNASYLRYGGRGIKVCERWSSYENFLEDMGERPIGFSLDRIDVEGDYTPLNCRWVDSETQQNNKSNSNLIEFKDIKQSISQWARALLISRNTLISRQMRGKSTEQILKEFNYE